MYMASPDILSSFIFKTLVADFNRLPNLLQTFFYFVRYVSDQ